MRYYEQRTQHGTSEVDLLPLLLLTLHANPTLLAHPNMVWPAWVQRPQSHGSLLKSDEMAYLCDIYLKDLQALQPGV